MAKADQAYHKRVLYITANEITLARWLAKKTIKAQLQRQGVKLTSIPAADVSRAAEAYFIEHLRELIVEAKALSVAFENNWPAPGSEDTEFGVLMEPEVGYGETTEVHTRVQA